MVKLNRSGSSELSTSREARKGAGPAVVGHGHREKKFSRLRPMRNLSCWHNSLSSSIDLYPLLVAGFLARSCPPVEMMDSKLFRGAFRGLFEGGSTYPVSGRLDFGMHGRSRLTLLPGRKATNTFTPSPKSVANPTDFCLNLSAYWHISARLKAK